MYIIVMDYQSKTITKLVWDTERASDKEIKSLLDFMGYHLPNVAYMPSYEEPVFDTIELSDILSETHFLKDDG